MSSSYRNLFPKCFAAHRDPPREGARFFSVNKKSKMHGEMPKCTQPHWLHCRRVPRGDGFAAQHAGRPPHRAREATGQGRCSWCACIAISENIHLLTLSTKRNLVRSKARGSSLCCSDYDVERKAFES